jgi:copper(I)-binding protein
MVRKLFGFLSMFFVLAACATPVPAATSGVHVENAWALPAAASPMSDVTGTPDMQSMSGMANMSGMSGSDTTGAVYFVIVNDNAEADTLIGAVTDVASQAGMHETRMNGDVAEMVLVTRVDIPAHGRFEFKPGDYHLMLEGLKRDLKVGETFKLTLNFEKSGSITIDVPVRMEK